MAESTIKPRRIEVRKAEWAGQDLYLFAYLRENLGTKTVEDPSGGSQTLYTYDEVQVRLPVPARMKREAPFAAASRRHAGQAGVKSAVHGAMKAVSARGDEVRQAVQDALTPPQNLKLVVGRRRLQDVPAGVRGKIVSALVSQAEWAKGELAQA